VKSGVAVIFARRRAGRPVLRVGSCATMRSYFPGLIKGGLAWWTVPQYFLNVPKAMEEVLPTIKTLMSSLSQPSATH